jgi:signal transduction histidine kinase
MENEIPDTQATWEDRLHPDEREWVINEFDEYMINAQKQLNLEYRLKHKDGSYIWVHDRSIALVDEEERCYRILGSIADITERIEASKALHEAHDNLEHKVEERTKELKEANARLQELDKLKSMFLASMSHELRTPLNSIIGFTGLLLMGMAGEINEEQNRQLQMVKNSANHLLDLINDILDISKIEADKIDLTIEEFELHELIEQVIEAAVPLLKGKDIQISTSTSNNAYLSSDRRRVKQVMMNLVSNAVKFTDKGSIRILPELVADTHIKISVSDTGIGIKEDDLQKLFKPFQQVDMSSTKKYEGTGLGLYLSRKLVYLLGGEISARSTYGEGTTFSFTLPITFGMNHKGTK